MKFKSNNLRASQLTFILAALTNSAVCCANEMINVVPPGQYKMCVLSNAPGAHVRVKLSLEDPKFDTQWHPLTGLLLSSNSGKPIIRIGINNVQGEKFSRITQDFFGQDGSDAGGQLFGILIKSGEPIQIEFDMPTNQLLKVKIGISEQNLLLREIPSTVSWVTSGATAIASFESDQQCSANKL